MSTTQESFITGVDFVTVPTNDFEASVDFYANVLGLPQGKQWGTMPAMEFQAGSLTIAVMDPTAFGQEFRPHSVPIAFQVDDVAAAREALEAKGVKFVTDMIDSGTCHQAIFLDPAGNALDLHHIYGDRSTP
jgi:predicted enzyme related to lactoylglutathione lyase